MIPLVYVFATDGYTETAIKDFLRKINTRATWVIKSPRLMKLAKRDYDNNRMLPVLTGRTGTSLEEYMLDEVSKHPTILTECAAVLLEDDVDMRDASIDQDEFLVAQHKRLGAKLAEINSGCTAQMICLYAAPEIETWFIEDWKNSFGKTGDFNQQIATQLRTPLNKIKETCDGAFERYSHHFREKLSVWLSDETHKLSIEHNITDKRMASYSKSYHGSKFLRSINPAVVETKCRVYFAKAYHTIQGI